METKCLLRTTVEQVTSEPAFTWHDDAQPVSYGGSSVIVSLLQLVQQLVDIVLLCSTTAS